jgi:hypothetical protein
MEQQPVETQPPIQVIEARRAHEGDAAYNTSDESQKRLNRRERSVLWGHERMRRSRVGMFLYLSFADAGVRSAAAMAASLETGPKRRSSAFRRMITNWRTARQQLERGIGFWD